MFNTINDACQGIGSQVLNSAINIHALFLGKLNHDYPDEIYWEIQYMIAKYMYHFV